MKIHFENTNTATQLYPIEEQEEISHEGRQYIKLGKSYTDLSTANVLVRILKVALLVILTIPTLGTLLLYRPFFNQLKVLGKEIWNKTEEKIHFVLKNLPDEELASEPIEEIEETKGEEIEEIGEVEEIEETEERKEVEKIEEVKKVEKIEEAETPQSLPIIQTTYQVSGEVDEADFNKYLFSHPKLLPQNKILLEHTICKATCPPSLITYHQFAPSASLDEKLHCPTIYENLTSKITCVPYWFDYVDANHFYIDFAHATSFGGAYRSYGCVQEERMFAEFRALAILAFKTQNGIHPCIDSYQNGGHRHYPPEAKPFPFIIESIERQFDISKTPYGGPFQKADDQTIINGISKVENPVPVNIVGLAAVDWRGVKNPKYELVDLIYHFVSLYLANEGAKVLSKQKGWPENVIHTAPWGCGAFLNNEKMMTAIQYLAARSTGVDLVFHGIGNPMNPHYTQDNVNQIIDWISQLINEKHSPQQILEILLEKSHSDPTWAPG